MNPIDKRCGKSRKNKFQAEKIRPIPMTNNNCSTNKGKIKIITANRLGLKKINNGKSTNKLMRKFIKLARMLDKGMISLGKIACFNIETLEMNAFVTSFKELVKNIQGIIPARTNMVKCGIFTLDILVNIKLMLYAKINGVSKAHQIPSLDPEYFVLKYMVTISQIM